MTPAIRVVEGAEIPFTLHRYEHDSDAPSYGLEAATKLGVHPDRMFKTLVARLDSKSLMMCLIPVAARLDLKKLASATGSRKADMAEPTAAERATGYVVGGISPLGGRKRLPAIIDATVVQHPTVYISAGQRGLQMELSPADLVRLTDAPLAPLTTST